MSSGRILHFIPRGAETLPAMLTSGEHWLNAEALRRLGGDDGPLDGAAGYDPGYGPDTGGIVMVDFARDAFKDVVVDSSERVEQFAREIARWLRQLMKDDDGES